MKEINIGVDIADTIIDVWPELIKRAELYNRSHSNNKRSEIKNLYLPEDIFNWSKEERNDFWSTNCNDLTFNVPILKGVKETLVFLKNNNVKINFITVKSNEQYGNVEKKLIEMLEKNNIPFDKLYTQIKNKGLLCKEKNIDYLIDDSYRNCLSMIEHGKTGILLNKPYNENVKLVDGIYRVNKFSDIKKYILK